MVLVDHLHLHGGDIGTVPQEQVAEGGVFAVETPSGCERIVLQLIDDDFPDVVQEGAECETQLLLAGEPEFDPDENGENRCVDRVIEEVGVLWP
jgi:hypothetical protein